MTLDDKRKVVEVLLCAGDQSSGLIDDTDGTGGIADLVWVAVGNDPARDACTYEDDAIEAAYRLIDSSHELRREWFGVR